jgi:hypothetical protein
LATEGFEQVDKLEVVTRGDRPQIEQKTSLMDAPHDSRFELSQL